VSEAPTKSPQIALAPAPTRAPPPVPAPRRSDLLAPVRRAIDRVNDQWLPLAVWHVGRSGRAGLVGIGLAVASAVFFFSTVGQVTNESTALRADLAKARSHPTAVAPLASEAQATLRHLPSRADMPALLGVLLQQAEASKLTLDTAKYEAQSTKTGDITRYKVSFPVTGPYPQVRQFVDAVLVALPAVSISELNIERKTISDGQVEARLRLTFYTRGAP
jgi:hypothetical protein